jgi:dolichyl-diphosphooligosaccharide--protein glycosyltransferase
VKQKKHSAREPNKRAAIPTINWAQALRSQQFWSVFFAAVFLAAALFTAWDVRQAPVTMEVAEQWAANSINQQGTSFFIQQVRGEYPLLGDAQVQQRAQEQWLAYASQNRAELDEQQKQLAAALRANYQYEATTADGTTYQQTYIFEMDPYYFLQKSVNFANTGSVCEPGSEQLDAGQCRDAKRLAPIGTNENTNLHIRLEALLIGFANARGVTDPITAVFLLPVLLIALSAIPAFFIARRFGGNVGGFIAAMMLVLHPVIMNRTVAGWVDTDAYAVVFPLFIIWFALKAYEAKTWTARIIYAALIGLTTGLYSTAWGGWWFMLFVTMFCMIGYVLYRILLLLRRSELRNTQAIREIVAPAAVVFGVFLLVTAITVSLLSTVSIFLRAFMQPFALSTGLQAATSGNSIGWPNILTTVAELNVPDLSSIVANFTGGNVLVAVIAAFGLFALLLNPRTLNWREVLVSLVAFGYFGLLFTQGLALNRYLFLALFALPLVLVVIYRIVRNEAIELSAGIFILGWLLATFFAATQGVRFILLGIPAFTIGFGIALGWLCIALSAPLIRRWKKQELLIQGALALVLILIVFNPLAATNPLKTGHAAALQQAPNINDAWWESMRFLREDTPADTIVTSWWDFGHWFRNIGNRSVTFDGGSQNPEPGHWVGKILLTNNEREATGILRMLNCGQNTAYSTLLPTLGVVRAKHLIDEIIVLERAEANERLIAAGVSATDAEIVLANTHCEPREQVFITSPDMVGKAGVWGHFGGWNFERSMAYEWSRTLPQAQAIAQLEASGLETAQATALYYEARALTSDAQANTWISPWPGYLSSVVRCQITATNESQELIVCPFRVNVGTTQQGTIIIEQAAFRADRPADAAVQLGVYGDNTRVGSTIIRLPRIVFADKETNSMTEYTTSASDLAAGMLIVASRDGEGNRVYQALLADPAQIDSMFTRLYFLKGAFTESFTPVHTSSESGGDITIWDVTWPNE